MDFQSFRTAYSQDQILIAIFGFLIAAISFLIFARMTSIKLDSALASYDDTYNVDRLNQSNTQISSGPEPEVTIFEPQPVEKVKQKEFKTPFINAFHASFKETSIDTDSVVRHFMLGGLFLADALVKSYRLIISKPGIDIKSTTKINVNNRYKINLLKKSDDELRAFLQGVEVVSNLDKEALINIILANKQAMSNFILEERRASLNKLTIQDLKSLLKGHERISRLRKADLIERVISLEKTIDSDI